MEVKLTKLEKSKKGLSVDELESLRLGSQVEGTIFDGEERRVFIKGGDYPNSWVDIMTGKNYKSISLIDFNDEGSLVEVNIKEVIYEEKLTS